MQKKQKEASVWFFVMAIFLMLLWSSMALAQSSYFTGQGCVDCHAAPVVATCNGCHAHGTHPSSAKSSVNVAGTTNKSSYAPGETVTATITGGYRTGWVRAVLLDQNGVELARSTGNSSGMGSSATFPATLSAPAPSTPGTYTWKVAWYGNQYDAGGAAFGANWKPDPNNPGHGAEIVNMSAPFTVASATLPAPMISSIAPNSLVQGVTNQPVSIAGTNLTGATVSFSNTGITAGTATVSASSISLPVSVATTATTGAGTITVTTAGGNASSVFSVTQRASEPILSVSTLSDGAFTNNVTLNVSGSFIAGAGVQSVSVNNQSVTVAPDGTFSTAITLVAGANTITVIATDSNGSQKTNARVINYDPVAPLLTISFPADNSTTTSPFITVSGSVNETSKVSVTNNDVNPQAAIMSGNNFSAVVDLLSGVNTINVIATDLAGNTSSVKRTVSYDTSKFELAVTNPSQDITTSRSSLTLMGTVTNSTKQITVTITMDGKTDTQIVTTGTFSKVLTFTIAKLYAVTVTASDAAGNKSTVTRNIIYRPVTRDDDDERTGGTATHPFGWTNPKSSHPSYVEKNGVSGCISCHSIDPASKGQRLSCYNCHGKEWTTPTTTGGTASHPFGWTNPKSSHPSYVEKNGVSGCVSCHSVDLASKGQKLSCYNCHGKEW